MFPLDSKDSSYQVQHMVDHAQPLYLWPLCLQCPTASGGNLKLGERTKEQGQLALLCAAMSGSSYGDEDSDRDDEGAREPSVAHLLRADMGRSMESDSWVPSAM